MQHGFDALHCLMVMIEMQSPQSKHRLMLERNEQWKVRERQLLFEEFDEEMEEYLETCLAEALHSPNYQEHYWMKMNRFQNVDDVEMLFKLLSEQEESDRKLAHVLHQEELDKIHEFNKQFKKQNNKK